MRNKIKCKSIMFFLTVYFSCNSFSQTLNDVSFSGRYIDAKNNSFYSTDFYITFTVHENLSVYDISLADVIELAEIWNSVNGSFFNFSIVDGASGYPIAESESWDSPGNPEINKIGLENPDKNHAQKFITFNPSEKQYSAIAVARNWIPPATCEDNIWAYPYILGTDIIINRYAPIKSLHSGECNDNKIKEYDIKSIILHELGHGAGINHHPSGTFLDVMYKKLKPGECKRTTLSERDKYAIKRLYSQDVGTTSSIPCSLFVVDPQDGLIGEEWDQGELPCCSYCDDTKIIDKDYSNDTKIKRAAKSITADVVTIKNNSNITFIASEYIELLEGFEVEEGSIFEAYIDDSPCVKPSFCFSSGSNIGCWGGSETKWDGKDDSILNADSIVSKHVKKNELKNNFVIAIPNTFSKSTTIQYSLKEKSTVTLSVFNIFGQRVAVLAQDEKHEAGSFFKPFNAAQLSHGIYFYTIEARSESGDLYKETKRMVILASP